MAQLNPIITAVAAAASVPDSSTDMTALWTASDTLKSGSPGIIGAEHHPAIEVRFVIPNTGPCIVNCGLASSAILNG